MQRIPQETYDAIWGKFRLRMNKVLGVFNMHGFQAFIPECADVITELAKIADENVRGAEKPITVEYARKRISKRKRKK